MHVMSEPKPFAALSSGLLARKGAARPAMRPQGFGQMSGGMDDLGWNDMGHSRATEPQAPAEEDLPRHVPSPISALTPMTTGFEEENYEPAPSVVEQQRAAIAQSFGEANEENEEHSVLATKAKKALSEELEADEASEQQEPEPIAPEPEPARYEAAPTVEAPAPSRVDAAAKAKAAFTLRLDAERHLKLRLACALSGRSAQQLVTEALDQLLHSKPEVEELAGRVPAKSR